MTALHFIVLFNQKIFQVGKTGKAVGIDHIPELVEMSRQNIGKDMVTKSMLETGRIQLVVGDGRQGYQAESPYDAIHVGAAAPTLPEAVSLNFELSFLE